MLGLLLADVLPIDKNFEFSPDPGPYIIMFAAGFVVATFGHIVASKTLVAMGLGLIYTALVILPLAVFLTQG